MSAVVKSAIVAGFGLLLAALLGIQVGEGSWGLPVMLAGIGVLAFAYALLFRGLRVEAVVLGLLLFGYIVGNRGFAQLGVGGSSSALFV